MKIGKHIGQRATVNYGSLNGKKGYVFKTIEGSVTFKNRDLFVFENRVLFVFDEPNNFTHKAKSYFFKHKDEWNPEFEKRCFWISQDKYELEVEKKVIL